jgi:hypothetical protein
MIVLSSDTETYIMAGSAGPGEQIARLQDFWYLNVPPVECVPEIKKLSSSVIFMIHQYGSFDPERCSLSPKARDSKTRVLIWTGQWGQRVARAASRRRLVHSRLGCLFGSHDHQQFPLLSTSLTYFPLYNVVNWSVLWWIRESLSQQSDFSRPFSAELPRMDNMLQKGACLSRRPLSSQ